MENIHPTQQSLTALIERVTYHNVENGYQVLKVYVENAPSDAVARDDTVTVIGVLPQLNVGETVEFSGQWDTHPKWGKQFKAATAHPILPTSKRGIERYLADTVAGVGPKTAERIVEHFGTETLSILSQDPERLYEVEGIQEKQISAIIETWQNNQGERDVIIFLQSLGITARMARRVFEEYQNDTIAIVRDNPYKLADDIYGISFHKADNIALEMGFDRSGDERIVAGISFALQTMALSGHTYVPRDELIAKAGELLHMQEEVERIESALMKRVHTGRVHIETLVVDAQQVEAVYLPYFHEAERRSTKIIYTMLSEASTLTVSSPQADDLTTYVADIVTASPFPLSKQQQAAVQAALSHKLTVLTGGPGTGKTTTLHMMIEAVEQLNDRTVMLAAPTGRAAKRLQEATGREARTIHRLLGTIGGALNDFLHDENNPLELDMLILDETSMLDLLLFYNVLKALPSHAHLVLVGDVDQLPSVGAGNVLRDVIDSGEAHVTRLDTIFRQDSRSHIVSNAHKINHGHMPYLSNESDDFFFFRIQEPQEAAEQIVDLVTNRITSKFGYDPMRDIQTLAPMYRGPVGVNALNKALQEALNPAGRPAEVKLDQRVFRVGDRVQQTKNNYDKQVFNGDTGIVSAIDPAKKTVKLLMDGEFIDYTYRDLDEVVLGYCISTHRSQGSEYPVVVMPVMPQHYMMLQRNLLYTAITRAKKLVILVGTQQAIAMAVNNNQIAGRYSGLKARLASILL